MNIRITNPIELDDISTVTLCKYADPTEDGREDITEYEAAEIAAEDPSLIYGLAAVEIIDRASGQHYEADLFGQDADLPPFDVEQDVQPMSARQYAWWADVLNRLQTSNDRRDALRSELDKSAAADLEDDIAAADCDLEDLPAVIGRCCDTAEFRWLVTASGKTQPEVAAYLGLSLSAVEKRLSGRARIRNSELVALATLAE